MKKRIIFSVLFCMILSTGIIPFMNHRGTVVQTASQKTLEKQAKKYLDKAAKDCDKVMDCIYDSWYFQVYDSDDYYDESILEPYSLECGIPVSKIRSIIRNRYDETEGTGIAACIRLLSTNLGIVDEYYTQKGTFKKIKSNLQRAKQRINKLGKSKKKGKLQKYYLAVNKYYKFVYNPYGSFSELSGRKTSLQEKVEDCRDALIFG